MNERGLVRERSSAIFLGEMRKRAKHTQGSMISDARHCKTNMCTEIMRCVHPYGENHAQTLRKTQLAYPTCGTFPNVQQPMSSAPGLCCRCTIEGRRFRHPLSTAAAAELWFQSAVSAHTHTQNRRGPHCSRRQCLHQSRAPRHIPQLCNRNKMPPHTLCGTCGWEVRHTRSEPLRPDASHPHTF